MTDHSHSRLAVIGVLLVVLHYVVSREVDVFSIRPNLLLMLACMAALALPFRQATTIAFFAGLIADLFTTVPFGTSALAFLVAAGIAGFAARNARPTPVVRAVVTYVASFIGVFIFAVVANISGQNSGSAVHIIWVASVVALVNAVVAPLLLVVTPQSFGRGRSNPGFNW